MTIPSKVIYQGKVCDVIGYVGVKYRLAGIGNVLMSHCAKYVEPIEGSVHKRLEDETPANVIMAAERAVAVITNEQGKLTAEAQKAVDIVKAMTKPKGGRPRKNAKA